MINPTIELGQNPDDVFLVMNKFCQLLEDMWQAIHNELYKDITFDALSTAEYERLRLTSCEKQELGVDGTTHVENLSGYFNSKPTASPGVAMQAPGHSGSGMQSN